jgi:hypothetical protein
MGVAQANFDALNPTNFRACAANTGMAIVGDLPNGNTVNVHTGTSTGGYTLEILDRATGTNIKIR